ncbi:MAG: hypothetical protein ACT452_14910 [Microthrixaceae bacterium]
MTRRVVRVDPQFFAELDAQLGEARGPNGEPSSSDFLLIDLPPIADAFAESFDEFPAMFTGREDYRYLVTTGTLIAVAVVIGQLVADGSIVLFGIEIDES